MSLVAGAGAPTLTLLQTPQPPLNELLLTCPLNAFGTGTREPAGGDVVLVLEDYHVIILARGWIAQAREGASGASLSRALRWLDRLRSDAAPKARQARVVEALILQALALAAQGNGPGALAALGLSLSLAVPGRYVRRMVEEGRPLQLRRQRLDASVVASRLAYVLLHLTAIAVAPRAGQRHAEPRPNSESPRAPQRSSLNHSPSAILRCYAPSPPATPWARLCLVARLTTWTHRRFDMTASTTTAKSAPVRAKWNLRGLARRLGIGSALIAGLALAGAGSEAVAARVDARAYPPPGQMFDAGCDRRHLQRVGAGGLTVVLDAGLGGTSLD